MQGVLRFYSFDEMEEGDCFLINHPYYSGCPHPNDMVVVLPVFHQGEVIAFCASMGRKGMPILGVNHGVRRTQCQFTCHVSRRRNTRHGPSPHSGHFPSFPSLRLRFCEPR